MADMVKEFHVFVLPEYEQEEEFLREKSRQGYHLVQVRMPGMYYFEKGEPKDTVYRLDFNPQTDSEKDSYIQMYKDYGWEYIQDLNEYSYFRKDAGTAAEEELEIFNDNGSRLEMVERIFRKKMLPMTLIFLFCSVIFLNYLLSVGTGIHPFMMVISVLDCILILLYVYVLVRCLAGFSRIRKKYGEQN